MNPSNWPARPRRWLLAGALVIGRLIFADATEVRATDSVGYEQLHAFDRSAGDGVGLRNPLRQPSGGQATNRRDVTRRRGTPTVGDGGPGCRSRGRLPR